MTLRSFRSSIHVTKVVAEFAKTHALFDRVHISLIAFEEVASLLNQRKTQQQKNRDTEARRLARETG